MASDLVKAAAPLVWRRFAAVTEKRHVKPGPLKAGRSAAAALKESQDERRKGRSLDHEQINQFC